MSSPERKGFWGKVEKFNKITRNAGIGIAIVGAVLGIPALVVLGLTGAVLDQATIEAIKKWGPKMKPA